MGKQNPGVPKLFLYFIFITFGLIAKNVFIKWNYVNNKTVKFQERCKFLKNVLKAQRK